MLASQFLLKYLSLTAARWLHNSMLKQLLRSVPIPFVREKSMRTQVLTCKLMLCMVLTFPLRTLPRMHAPHCGCPLGGAMLVRLLWDSLASP